MKHKRKRLFIDPKTSAKEREKTIYLAVENECNTLVFSFNDNYFKDENKKQKYINLIKTHALSIEAGGHDLPLLLPKHLFLSNRELFRMEHGKRIASPHFCPTNPKTISIISERANVLFTSVLEKITPPRIFHFLPDKGYENIWCACPACRAFSPAEQYLIAVNTAADVLAKHDRDAVISYIDLDTEPEAEGISPRKNMVVAD